jgi:hypothetical protein
MALSRLLARIVAYLRAGYPEGVPANDYILCSRYCADGYLTTRLAVATELMSTAPTPIEGTDVRVAITGGVKRRLIATGWPVTDSLGFLE